MQTDFNDMKRKAQSGTMRSVMMQVYKQTNIYEQSWDTINWPIHQQIRDSVWSHLWRHSQSFDKLGGS